MIKTSQTKYVLCKRYDHYMQPAIPMGKIEGQKALFLLFMSRNHERYVYLSKDEIM